MNSTRPHPLQHSRAKILRHTLAAASLVFASSIVFAQTPAPPPPPPPGQHPIEFPPGQGRDTVLRVCSKCHSPLILLANPRTREAWEDTITKMAGLGAEATDAEFSDILDYLSANVNPDTMKVNVNRATSTTLQSALTLTPKDADAIIAYRAKNGDFKTLDDLKKVPGVDTKKIDDHKDKLTF
jgi:competence protein ComEA